MKSNSISVSIEDVSKSFDGFTAVSDLTISIRRGTMYGLLGPNGAGKTTTIRMVVNIALPDSGRILLFGQSITPELQDRIGYLPEERGLYRKMRVGEQLAFFAELKNIDSKLAAARIDYWLERLGLKDWKRRRTIELSKGMQQKMQFITAVLHDPDLIILDEPFSGLDPINTELLKGVVLELRDAGKTIILSTHQMHLVEKICDEICLLNRSRKVLEGSVREVKQSYGANMVALRVVGGETVLSDRTLVSRCQHHSDEIEALLVPGADPQELLQRLVASGASISRFELIEPSLNEIFIAKVSEAPDA
jgi:ABC-2 type transport system ATP-binding protein